MSVVKVCVPLVLFLQLVLNSIHLQLAHLLAVFSTDYTFNVLICKTGDYYYQVNTWYGRKRCGLLKNITFTPLAYALILQPL